MDIKLLDECIEYIIQNFSEDLTAKEVAEHFHYSEYYFCREFKKMTGKSVYQFIKALKMDQSAVDIKLNTNKSITEIGLDYGYSSSNYSSAFKSHHHLSPAEFRQSANKEGVPNPFYSNGAYGFTSFEEYAAKIQIKELPDRIVLYERVVGNYVDLKNKWPEFVKRYEAYVKTDTVFMERFYNDPSITDVNSCIYDVCMTMDEQKPEQGNTMVIEGGKYAVYHYEGEIKDIFCTVQGIFTVWLPDSGYIMSERYALNIYPKIEADSNYVIMDLCIPIQ